MNKEQELSKALEKMTACCNELSTAALAICNYLKSEAKDEEETADKTVQPEAPTKDDSKTYTFADVRKAFSAKAHAGFTPQIKELLTSYGADKLSAVNESDYSRLMHDLEGIA